MEGVSINISQNTLLQSGSDIINKELTAKLQKQEKYVNFNNWLKANGVVYDGVEYPVAFGQQGLIGAAATKDIAPLTAFISIPNKIIISYDRAKFSELKSLFKQSNDLFSEKENDEAGLNMLTVFFMYERLKGKKSLWHEYFEILENTETILTWTAEEINGIPDPYIQKQAKEYREQVDELWSELKQLLHSQTNFFSKASATKELFLWAYNVVMSRCFGYTEKGTCIIPFADCLNHSKYHATHFYVHKEFELNQANKHPQYNIKKRTLDLSIVDPLLANKVTPTFFKNEVLGFLRHYKEDGLFNDSSVRSQMIPIVRQINIEQLQKNQDQEIWTSQFFTTSDEEDNDTDSDDEEEKKKAREMSTLKLKENSSMREALERVRRYEEKLRNQPKMTLEDEEKSKQDRRIADEQYQQQLLEKQKKKIEQEAKEDKVSQEEEQLDLKNLYFLDEDKYDWYNCQDNQIYFIFASNKPLVKGEQIYNFYGRRTNRYLMCWYGFTYLPNEYDSLAFRLFLHKKSEEINESNIKEILYSDYISFDEWESGVKIGSKTVPTDVLSKEFRLKDGLLCDELINYMRINKMQHYNGLDRDLIMLTQPRSINFELRCIEAALIVIKELKDRYLNFSSQVKQVGAVQGGKNSSLPLQVAHQQFSKILYDGHMRALERQTALLNISKEILQEVAKGADNFKQIYLKLYSQFETEQDYSANREYLRKYLKAINDGIVSKTKQK